MSIASDHQQQDAGNVKAKECEPYKKPEMKSDYTRTITPWTGSQKLLADAGIRYPVQDNAQWKGFFFNEDYEKLGEDGEVYCTVYLGQKFGRLSTHNAIGAIVSLWAYNVEMSKPGHDATGYRKAFSDELCDIVSDLVGIVSRNRDIFSDGGDNDNPFLNQPAYPIQSRHQHDRPVDPRNPQRYPAVKAYWSAIEDSVRFILTSKLEIEDLVERYEKGDRSCDFVLEEIRPKQLVAEVAQRWAKVGLELYDVAWTCLNTDRGRVQDRAQKKMISQKEVRKQIYRIGTSRTTDYYRPPAKRTPWSAQRHGGLPSA